MDKTTVEYGFYATNGSNDYRSGWYDGPNTRDVYALDAVARGDTVTLTERTTTIKVTLGKVLRPKTPEDEARERVLNTPLRTLFLSARGGVYERSGDTIIKLSAGQPVEGLIIFSDFWQGLRRLAPEGE